MSEESEMLERVGQYKKEISEHIDQYLEEWVEKEENPTRWRKDISERMSEMAKGGKMVRGSLVIITHKFYGGESTEDCLKVASAIELLHTGILMHDDIIDKDDYRRGMKSFQKQYRDLAEEEDIHESKHFGMSMGIAGGDVSFFMGQSLLSDLDISPEIRRRISELVFNEFSNVGLAEQVDVYAGYAQEELTEERILQLYRDKTARYTFSLPLNAGAVMAEADQKELEKLYSLGEKLGIIFQLKDDELGLFGEEKETGKSVGSDLDENKKTVHRLRMLQKLPEKEREQMKDRLKGELSPEDKDEIIEMMSEKDIEEEVRKDMEEMAQDALNDISELELDEDAKDFFRDLTEFCLNRNR